MICPHCQKQIPSDSLVCGYCGHKIEEALQKEENQTAAPEENISPAPEKETSLSAGETEIISETAAEAIHTEVPPDSEPEINASEEKMTASEAIEEATLESVSSSAAEKDTVSSESSVTASSEAPVEESLVTESPAPSESKTEPVSPAEPVSNLSVEPATDQKTEGFHGKKAVSPEKKLEEAYIRRMAKRQRPLKTASFFWTEFLLLIPGVNLVLLFVWAFRKRANANRKAFARSILIWLLLFIVFLLIVLIVMIVLGVPIDKYIWLKSFQDWVAGLKI